MKTLNTMDLDAFQSKSVSTDVNGNHLKVTEETGSIDFIINSQIDAKVDRQIIAYTNDKPFIQQPFIASRRKNDVSGRNF